MGADDEFCIRALAHQVSREQVAAKLGLAVPGWHGNDQAFALTGHDPVQGFGYAPVVFPDQHFRPHVLAEIDEVSRCALLGLEQLQPKLQAHHLFFSILRRSRFV